MTKTPKLKQQNPGWLVHVLAPDRYPSPNDAMRAIADVVQVLRSDGHNVASLGHALRSIAEVIDPPPKRGPKGPRNKAIDRELLRIYDVVSVRHPLTNPLIFTIEIWCECGALAYDMLIGIGREGDHGESGSLAWHASARRSGVHRDGLPA